MVEHIPRSILGAYIQRTLESGERERVESHVEACAACHDELVELEFNRISLPETLLVDSPSEATGDARPPPVVTRLIGPYRVIEELGRGGQAVVYLVEDTRLQRKVALKVFAADRMASDHPLQRFQREAASLSRLDHAGICTVHDTGEHEGHPFIAMKYVEGESLAQRIARTSDSALDPMPTVRLIERAARALHAAHEAGVVHRDIKPSNILIARDGEPVLVDFGLARDEESRGLTVTRTGDLTGTPAYMSPEQVRGDRRAVDRRSDVFALGVTLYEALTLQLPFGAPTAAGMFQRILAGDWTPPSETGRRLPRDLIVILQTALEPDLARRYQTALALAEDLRRFRERETILARPAGPGLRLRRLMQRNPVVSVSLLAVFLILATGLGISLLLLGRVRRESEARAESLRREEGLRLALHSTAILGENPGRALLLAIEAAERSPSLAANNALLRAVLTTRERARLPGHTGIVNCASFSPDGRSIVTASADRTSRVWDASSGRCLAVATGHDAEVKTAEFSPDGGRILTAALDATARLWDPRTGKELLRLTGHGHGLLLARFSPDGSRILTVGRDTARIWDSRTGQLLHSLASHRAPILCAVFSPDGSLVATGSEDRSAILWDAQSGDLRASLEGHEDTITAVDFSGTGDKLVSAAKDGGAFIWDARDGSRIVELKGHDHAIRSARFSRDGAIVATASDDFTARIWDAQSGKEQFSLPHDHAVLHLDLSRDGRTLLTASVDGKARLWDTSTGGMLAELKGHEASLLQAAFSPGGGLLVTASVDRTSRVWSTSPLWPRKISSWNSDSVEMAWIDPPGDRVAALRKPNTSIAEISRVQQGMNPVQLAGHQGPITALRFHPDGKHVLTASRDATARLWDAGTGELVREFRGHSGPVLSAHLSADGKRFATWSEDRSVRVWSTDDGAQLARFDGPPTPNSIASLSPDGRNVVCGARDGSLVLASVDSGESLRTLETATQYSCSADWSPDGQQIVMAVGAGRVQIRDPFTGTELGALIHPSGSGFALYSPDGRWIGTECYDFTVRLWDARSHEKVLELKVDGFVPSSISFDARGRWIAGFNFMRNSQIAPRATSMGRLLCFPLHPLEEAREVLPGALTPDEHDQFSIGSAEERAAYRARWQIGESPGAGR